MAAKNSKTFPLIPPHPSHTRRRTTRPYHEVKWQGVGTHALHALAVGPSLTTRPKGNGAQQRGTRGGGRKGKPGRDFNTRRWQYYVIRQRSRTAKRGGGGGGGTELLLYSMWLLPTKQNSRGERRNEVYLMNITCRGTLTSNPPSTPPPPPSPQEVSGVVHPVTFEASV